MLERWRNICYIFLHRHRRVMYWGISTTTNFVAWVLFAVLFSGGCIFLPMGVLNWMGCKSCYNAYGGTPLSTIDPTTTSISQAGRMHAWEHDRNLSLGIHSMCLRNTAKFFIAPPPPAVHHHHHTCITPCLSLCPSSPPGSFS